MRQKAIQNLFLAAILGCSIVCGGCKEAVSSRQIEQALVSHIHACEPTAICIAGKLVIKCDNGVIAYDQVKIIIVKWLESDGWCIVFYTDKNSSFRRGVSTNYNYKEDADKNYARLIKELQTK